MAQANQKEPIHKFGDKLAKMRTKAQLTQWDVAHACQFTTAQFISNWERGVSKPPMDKVPTLARLFRVSERSIYELMRDCELAEVSAKFSNLGLPRIKR